MNKYINKCVVLHQLLPICIFILQIRDFWHKIICKYGSIYVHQWNWLNENKSAICALQTTFLTDYKQQFTGKLRPKLCERSAEQHFHSCQMTFMKFEHISSTRHVFLHSDNVVVYVDVRTNCVLLQDIIKVN